MAAQSQLAPYMSYLSWRTVCQFCGLENPTDDHIIKHGRKVCLIPECGRRCTFGFILNRTKVRVYCTPHGAERASEQGMMYLPPWKVCAHGGCLITPSYGTRMGLAVHCSRHRLEHEVPVFRAGRKCTNVSCFTQATFGTTKGKAVHCKRHRRLGEWDVRNPRCAVEDCTCRAAYGQPGGLGVRCYKHVEPGDVMILLRPRKMPQ